MKLFIYPLVLGLLLGVAATATAQTRRPVPSKGKPRPGTKAGPMFAAPVESAKRVETSADDKPPLIINKIKLKDPVLVYYQQAAPNNAVQQLLMDEKSLVLLKTMPLEDLVARREVFIDGLSNYDPPKTTVDADKYRLTGVSMLASSEKRHAAPDGRSTYARLKVPSPGDLYVVRESAEEYRHFVSGPQKKGSRIDFAVNVLPGVDSVRAVYTLRKMDASEHGDIIR
ncbi:hypothetical protein GO988_02970 [Hymenobacter sp. HMF4947]|uniref:Uncharacterized protein n=1 Tax=Hymenobacter ginkgonis TaxID=2682976 RepID=A0A7K1TA59_9BACT|nr:hypothetical protein [Hymenobacter ginkgonis]MVN75279.1 hypothetical protein [Hymenobacter ginkgonis]